MIRQINTTYTREDTIDFIIDDDKQLEWLGQTEALSEHERIFIVIDKNVKKTWQDQLLKQLKKHNKPIHTFTVQAKESSKSTSFYPELVAFLESHKANLSDVVIAVGGGIIIDLVSFTTSTYMRGLPLFIIATTLIGMIDASTAGKTCLSTQNNKNILGTFYYPKVVYNNVHFLKTYSPRFHRQGLSESFKYGILTSKKLVNVLLQHINHGGDSTALQLVEEGINARVKIRHIHPQASNLGHTFGHAIEKMSNYTILHGDAITAGTVLALYFGLDQGVIQKTAVNKIVTMIKDLGLNMYIDKSYHVDEWIDLMMADKKSTATKLNLVLLTDIYKPYQKADWPFYTIKPTIVKAFLKEFLKKYPYAIDNSAQAINQNKLTYSS